MRQWITAALTSTDQPAVELQPPDCMSIGSGDHQRQCKDQYHQAQDDLAPRVLDNDQPHIRLKREQTRDLAVMMHP